MITFSKLGYFGRLGNQLFEIASTIGIAVKNNDVAIFPKWYCDYTKKEMSSYFKNPIHQTVLDCKSFPTHLEPNVHYDEVSYQNNINLHGWFQSEKYFKHCEQLIRHYFEPNPIIIKKLEEKYRNKLLIPYGKETCSIHVRRGDYVDNAFHDAHDMDYFTKAIECIKDRRRHIQFIVFSDDITWCKKHFPEDFIFIENNLSASGAASIHRKNDTDIEELFLMSMCKHNIITNSSFSWWASWLNKNPNKIIVAPEKWFGEGGPSDKDIYTKEMVKL